jgi:hypothetical protein
MESPRVYKGWYFFFVLGLVNFKPPQHGLGLPNLLSITSTHMVWSSMTKLVHTTTILILFSWGWYHVDILIGE